MGNDSNVSNLTNLGGAATASIATVGGAAGIVPADNRDGDGKGLKSDEVRDELTGGKESGSAAASAAVNPPSKAVCDVGTSTNLSAGVNESEAASPKQQLAVATVVNEPRRSKRLTEEGSNDEEVGRDADTTSRAAANGEDSLSEEVSLWYED